MNNKFKKALIFFVLGVIFFLGLYQIGNPLSTAFAITAWGLIISFVISIVFATISLFKDSNSSKIGSLVVLSLIAGVVFYFYSKNVALYGMLEGM